MKYCLRYAPLINGRYKEADELFFIHLEDLKSYIYDNRETKQRLIIEIDEDDDYLKDIKELREMGYDIAICTSVYCDKLIDFSEANIPFFFYNHCNNWENLHTLISLGVSDVYIVEQLGFELDKVKKICGDKVQIRTYPNVCQLPAIGGKCKLDKIYGFFITPNEIPIYEKYIDVCEFFYNSQKKEEVYFDIYKNESWLGNLKDLIGDFDEDIYSQYLFPTFGIYRSVCGRECLKGEKCNLCQRAIELSNEFQKEGKLLKLNRLTKEEE